MARLYLILLILGLMSSIGYAGYSYYMWSQETIGTLRENNVKLKSAAETLQVTVDKMAEDAQRNEELNRNLTNRLQKSQEHLDKLRGVFAEIDLTMEALTNAQGLEDRVNAAVKKLINRIQNETTPPSDDPIPTDSMRDEDGGNGSSGPN